MKLLPENSQDMIASFDVIDARPNMIQTTNLERLRTFPHLIAYTWPLSHTHRRERDHWFTLICNTNNIVVDAFQFRPLIQVGVKKCILKALKNRGYFTVEDVTNGEVEPCTL